MKCVVGCLPEGFDYKMVINSGDTLSGTFFDQVWGHEFKGNPGDQLTIIVTAKNKIAKPQKKRIKKSSSRLSVVYHV